MHCKYKKLGTLQKSYCSYPTFMHEWCCKPYPIGGIPMIENSFELIPTRVYFDDDTNYAFDAAICYSDFDGDGVGEWKTFEINDWTDYSDGDSIQIKTKYGDVFLFHASNCTLINRD